MSQPIAAAAGGRLHAVDVARTVALAMMIAFHLLYDLVILGFRDPFGPWFLLWAKGIAGSFLALAGVSLWLAHGRGTRWGAFAKRLALLAAAALAVSVATRVAMPDWWVRWGILHAIAAGSLIGIALIRAPWPVIAALGAAAFALRPALLGVLEGPLGLVLGTARAIPPMMDYEPILPWAGPLLLGLAGAKALGGRLHRLRTPDTALLRMLAWPGRHSLAIYLLHQPVIFGTLLLLR